MTAEHQRRFAAEAVAKVICDRLPEYSKMVARAAEERERQARELPRRCETCAHWRRLRNNHRIGQCQAVLPLPFWAERDRRNGSDYTFPDDGDKCPFWRLADTPPISPAT